MRNANTVMRPSRFADEARLSLIVVAPKSAQVHQMMAHELARQGQTKEAIENYKIALQIDPKLPGLHFELAELMNTSAAAKESLLRARKPSNDTVIPSR